MMISNSICNAKINIDKKSDKLPILFSFVLYLFFSIRLSPDLLSNSLLWQSVFILYTIVGILTIIISGKLNLNRVFLKWYIPFFIWAFLSRFWASSFEHATDGLDIYIVIFITFSILSLLVTNMTKVYQVIKIIMLSLITMFINLLISLDWSLLFDVRLGLDNINTNWNANDIGFKLAIFVFMSVFLVRKNQLSKTFSLLFFNLIIIFFIILTGSRMAIITITLILLFYFSFDKRKSIYYVISGFFFIIVGYFFIMNIPFFYNNIGYRFEGILTGDSVEGSFIGRSKMIELGIEWFKERPFIGYGLDNYRALSPFKTYSHNTYIELLVNLGLLGLILYYKLYFNLIINSIKMLENKNFVLAIIVSGFILDVMNVSYQSFLWNILLWLAIIVQETNFKKHIKSTIFIY